MLVVSFSGSFPVRRCNAAALHTISDGGPVCDWYSIRIAAAVAACIRRMTGGPHRQRAHVNGNDALDRTGRLADGTHPLAGVVQQMCHGG